MKDKGRASARRLEEKTVPFELIECGRIVAILDFCPQNK